MTRYLTCIIAFAILILGSIGIFNYNVDPFLLYKHRDGGDQMLGRIDQFYNMRLYKPYHVQRLKPEAVIVGTSRSGSIQARHQRWDNLRFYNYAMPGMTIFELGQLARHAQEVQPLSRLIIGLDYHALVRATPKSRPGFEQARLVAKPSDFYSPRVIGQWLLDLQAFLFSFDMVGESIRALRPSSDMPRVYYKDGAWKGVGKALAGRGGYIYVSRSAIRSTLFTRFRLEDNLPYLRDLLHYCYRNDIDTTLLFTPTHVFFVDLWFRIASQALWRNMHREVVTLNAEIAREYGRAPFAIWGFGDEQNVVAEPIYRARDIDKAWFKDGAHYGTRLGDAIMDALLGSEDGFGKKLTPDSVDTYLDRVDAIRQTFLQSNRQQVDDMHKAIGGVPELRE